VRVYLGYLFFFTERIVHHHSGSIGHDERGMPSLAGVAALVDEVARIVFGEMTSAARLRLHAVMTLYLHGKRSVGGGWFEDATQMLAVRFSNAAGRRFLDYRIGGVSHGPKPPPKIADFLRSATGLDDNLIDGVMAAISNGNLNLLSRASVAEAAGAEAAPAVEVEEAEAEVEVDSEMTAGTGLPESETARAAPSKDLRVVCPDTLQGGGAIEISQDTTLADARAAIMREFDDAQCAPALDTTTSRPTARASLSQRRAHVQAANGRQERPHGVLLQAGRQSHRFSAGG